MNQNNATEILTNSVKVGAPAVLLGPVIAPVAMPIIHGLAGVALVGLGIFAAGSLVFSATEKLTGGTKARKRE